MTNIQQRKQQKNQAYYWNRKMAALSEYDNLAKHTNDLPVGYEDHVDDLDEILFEPVPSEDQ